MKYYPKKSTFATPRIAWAQTTQNRNSVIGWRNRIHFSYLIEFVVGDAYRNPKNDSFDDWYWELFGGLNMKDFVSRGDVFKVVKACTRPVIMWGRGAFSDAIQMPLNIGDTFVAMG